MAVNAEIATWIAEIKKCTSKLEDIDGMSILKIIELASLYIHLQANVRPKQWGKTLEELGVHVRVANRYLIIGGSWWPKHPPGPELLSLMPNDVHKLEWIARLPSESLATFLRTIDCREGSRGAVIAAVQRVLGTRKKSPKAPKMTWQDLKKRWSDYVDRMIDAIDNLGDQEIDETCCKELVDSLRAKYVEMEDALTYEVDTGEEPADSTDEESLIEDEESHEESVE